MKLSDMEKDDLYRKISDRNFGIFTHKEQEKIRNGKLVIVGQGCVGELATVVVARVGIGNITVVDGDTLSWSNFNRNPLARSKYIGKPKVDNIVEIIRDSNPTLDIVGIKKMLTEKNAKKILTGHDIVLNLVDSMYTRVVVHRIARQLGLPCVTMSGGPKYRAIVSTFMPDGIDYETAFSIPTKGKPMNKDAEALIGELKKERAQYAAEHGADPEWAKLYISGEREYWAVTPMRTYNTAAFAAQEAINFIVYGKKGVLAKAPDARIFDLDGYVFTDLGIQHPKNGRITEVIARNVLTPRNRIYRMF